MLDDSNILARAAETKMIPRESQDDLAVYCFLCVCILLYLSEPRWAAREDKKWYFELLITVGQFLPWLSKRISLMIQRDRAKSC